MHTKEEARRLWCPMVRYEGDDGANFNRGTSQANPTNSLSPDDDRYVCNCIADKCAMWRWDVSWPVGGKPVQLTTGHCGLAGNHAWVM